MSPMKNFCELYDYYVLTFQNFIYDFRWLYGDSSKKNQLEVDGVDISGVGRPQKIRSELKKLVTSNPWDPEISVKTAKR